MTHFDNRLGEMLAVVQYTYLSQPLQVFHSPPSQSRHYITQHATHSVYRAIDHHTAPQSITQHIKARPTHRNAQQQHTTSKRATHSNHAASHNTHHAPHSMPHTETHSKHHTTSHHTASHSITQQGTPLHTIQHHTAGRYTSTHYTASGPTLHSIERFTNQTKAT